MRKKVIYVAGPMTGIPMFNWPLFFLVARSLREQGWDVINPAEQDVINSVNPFESMSLTTRDEVLRDDFRDIITKAEAIALLPGWQESEGAKLECLISQTIGNEAYVVILDDNLKFTLELITRSIVETKVVSLKEVV